MGETESNNASGACYKTTVKTSVAVSPAFIIEGIIFWYIYGIKKICHYHFSAYYRLQLDVGSLLFLDGIEMGNLFD